MAGFGGAIAGALIGALGGAGQGMRWSIEKQEQQELEDLRAARAERLANLQIASSERIAGGSQALQKQQIEQTGRLEEAQRLSNERMTQLQLGTQKGIAELQARTTTEQGALNRELSREEIAAHTDQIMAQIQSGEKIATADRTSREKLGEAEIKSRKELQQMQNDAAERLNTTFVTQADGSSVMMQGGKAVPMPVDPATGKPINPAITDNDTPEMKNIKYLMTFGIPYEKAVNTVLGAKNADRNLLQVGVFKSMADSASTLKNLTDDDLRELWTQSGDFVDQLPGMEKAAPAAPASATAPQIEIPATMTDAQLKAEVDAAIAAGKDRAALRNALTAAGKDPAKFGL